MRSSMSPRCRPQTLRRRAASSAQSPGACWPRGCPPGCLSIVGAARIDDGYYARKAEQERILLGTHGGWTMLRATQFHEFVEQMLPRGRRGPLQFAPTMRTQPIAAAEVAGALVSLAEGEPRGAVPELAGPREERLAAMIGRMLRTSGSRRPVFEVPLRGAFGRRLRDGSILPDLEAILGTLTFDEWLAARSAG